MIQYADDVAYMAQKQDDDYQFGVMKDFLWPLTKFSYSFAALKMLKKSPVTGFYVPWTRGKGNVAKFGRKMGVWGSSGWASGTASTAERSALRIFRSSGVFGFNAARRKVAAAMGEQVATKVGSRFIIGRAAGLAIPALNVALWAPLVVGTVVGTYKWAAALTSKYRGLELGGYFPETQGAYTSRQRSLQAITASRLQARSAIGNEAMLFHR